MISAGDQLQHRYLTSFASQKYCPIYKFSLPYDIVGWSMGKASSPKILYWGSGPTLSKSSKADETKLHLSIFMCAHVYCNYSPGAQDFI